MDEEGFKKTCIKEKEKKGRHPTTSLSTVHVADFILRQDAGRFMLGKYLSESHEWWCCVSEGHFTHPHTEM